MMNYATLGGMIIPRPVKATMASLRTKAKKSYKDPDRVNFKSQKDYEKHEATESPEEKAVEMKAAQAGMGGSKPKTPPAGMSSKTGTMVKY